MEQVHSLDKALRYGRRSRGLLVLTGMLTATTALAVDKIPIFVRQVMVAYTADYGSSTPDQESETFTTRTVIKDLHIAVDLMRGVAGCLVRVQKVSAAGSRVTLFENWYMDILKDTGRDDRVTQQNLGVGVVFEIGDQILTTVGNITDPETPQVEPSRICSTTVQAFGHALE